MGEIEIKTSIIDYLESVNGGVQILVSITLYHFSFQGIYWLHPNCYILECEDNFLLLWGVENTIDLPFYEEICKDIDMMLINKDEIFKELL